MEVVSCMEKDLGLGRIDLDGWIDLAGLDLVFGLGRIDLDDF